MGDKSGDQTNEHGHVWALLLEDGAIKLNLTIAHERRYAQKLRNGDVGIGSVHDYAFVISKIEECKIEFSQGGAIKRCFDKGGPSLLTKPRKAVTIFRW